VVANNDVTVTTDLGVITIAAGSSSGTLNVPVQGNDVYINTKKIENSITDVVEKNSGAQGAFENLEFDAGQVSTTVKDTLDPVTVKLKVSEAAVDEGAVDNLVYTVYLEDADGNAVTASNDITVTTTLLGDVVIKAGDSFATANHAVQGDDVYIDAETIINEITAVAEANSGEQGAL